MNTTYSSSQRAFLRDLLELWLFIPTLQMMTMEPRRGQVTSQGHRAREG